jgi:hypothetical protein
MSLVLADLDPFGMVAMLLGVLLLAFLFLVNTRQKINRRRGGPKLTPQEKLERMRQVNGTKDDLREMMVELEELTRRFSAQLDAKSVRLEKLIEEADRKIEQLGGRADGGSAGNGSGESTSTLETGRVASGGSGGGAEAGSGAGSGGGEPEPEPLDPATRSVYELADQGLSSLDIARQLDEHVGKVELILALRQQ